MFLFQIDPFAALILAVLLSGLVWRLRNLSTVKPALLYSSLSLIQNRFHTWREKFHYVPSLLFLSGVAALCIAFIDPHYFTNDQSISASSREGLALFLVLDRSGSMGKVIDHEWTAGRWKEVTQFDQLKKVSEDFIKKTPQDLIGVVAFARSAQVVAPLTLDHSQLIKKIQKLSIIKDQKQDGTSMGYAIYKTAHLIGALKAYENENQTVPYDIKGAAIIVISDGLQNPSLLDRGNALRTMDLISAGGYVKEQNIHLYVVHVGNLLGLPQFAPNKRELENAVQQSDGRLLIAKQMDAVEKVLDQIQHLEKSRIAGLKAQALVKVALYPYFILAALVLIGASILLESTLFRRLI